LQKKINMMTDEKVIRRLLNVLRLGGSDQIHEADAALAKGVQMMNEHGITIEGLLDQIRPNDLSQPVVADLARRYCLSRPDLGPSARDAYYRTVFLRIAELYAPGVKAGGKTKSPTPSESKPAGEKAERPSGERRDDARERADWKSRMDEAREKATQAREREEAAERARQAAEERARTFQEENEILRQNRETTEKRKQRFPRYPFLSDVLSSPLRILRLFIICCLYAFPRGLVCIILLSGGLQELGIHTFDGLGWIDALTIAMFPFTIIKGRDLYGSGRY
jgi:hypothetical protein